MQNNAKEPLKLRQQMVELQLDHLKLWCEQSKARVRRISQMFEEKVRQAKEKYGENFKGVYNPPPEEEK